MNDIKLSSSISIDALIIDDDRFMINLVSRVMAMLGITKIRTALDGETGINALNEAPADLVICDLNMPGMDGIEFMRHLSEAICDPAIIIMSGEDKRILQTAKQLAEARNINVLGVIQKPVTRENLSVLIEKYKNSKTNEKIKRSPLEKLTIEQIKEGLVEGCLIPFFQPKLCLKTGNVMGAEALARWQKKDGSILPAGSFIPIAEEGGLMNELTDAMLKATISQASSWLMSGINIETSVNISVDDLNRMDFPEYIENITIEAGLPMNLLTLELTETGVMKDILGAMEILSRLRMKGMGLAIDDFGTGFSSMQQLKRLPFTELKIDRAFVFGAGEDKEARAMLESSLALARSLDLYVVAEGAETQSDWDVLEEVGVDAVQGYFVSKPLPADEFEKFIENRSD